MYIKKPVLILSAIILVIATVVLTVGIVNPFGFTAMGEFFKFSLYSRIIQDSFYKDVDASTYANYAIEGIAAGTEDPYTAFYWGEDAQSYVEGLEGSFSGVGIYIENHIEDDTITVVSPISGGPADEAGIAPGDKILAVDGTAYTGSQIDEATTMMRGEPGTMVKLTIYRKHSEQIEEFELQRQEISIPSVEGEMLEQNIGLIRISQFIENTSMDFADVFHSLSEQGMESLVLDLRNNPGGILDVAVEIADLFLDEGQTILSVQDKTGYEEKYVATEGKVEIPLVVLSNQGSASASEVLIGALKDHGVAYHIGEVTFGKGVVQAVSMLGEDILSVTYAQYFTPNQQCIHEMGIVPDEEVLMDFEKYINLSELSYREDDQLQAAIAHLTE